MEQNQIALIPVGDRGLNGSNNTTMMQPDELLVANNVSFESGNIQKEGGAAKYNATALTGTPKVLGGWDWWPDTVTQRSVIMTDAGDLLKDTGAGTYAVTLKAGLTATNYPVFVEGGKEVAANNRKLFIFTGNNVVQVLAADGATTGDITSPPADWATTNQPICGVIHDDRLMGAGNLNDPHRIYYSTTASHEDILGGGTISIFPGEGDRIINMISFKGLVVIFKAPRGIYVLDTTDPTVSNWTVSRITESIGIASQRSVAMVDGDITIMDHAANLQVLSAIQEYGSVGSRNLNDAQNIGEWIRRNIDWEQSKDQVQLLYYPLKRELHISMVQEAAGAADNDIRFVMDMNREFPRFRSSDRDMPISMWLRQVNGIKSLALGDDAGFVWDLDQSTKSVDGVGYNAFFQTPFIDFSYIDQSLGTRQKNGKFLEIVIDNIGNWDLDVDVFWDGSYEETVTFSFGQYGSDLGTFTIGTNALGGAAILSAKKRITGSGRRISLVVRNDSAIEDFSISKIYLHFNVGDEAI